MNGLRELTRTEAWQQALKRVQEARWSGQAGIAAATQDATDEWDESQRPKKHKTPHIERGVERALKWAENSVWIHPCIRSLRASRIHLPLRFHPWSMSL